MLIRRLQGIQDIFTEFKQVRNIGPDNKINIWSEIFNKLSKKLAISWLIMEIYANVC